MARNRPGAKNIIAILLGASTFPHYPKLDPSPTFAKSAKAFEEYLRTKLSLLDSQILWLFDKDQQPGQQLSSIRTFIKKHILENSDLSDVIFFYCGHGAYLSEDEYVLALNCTDVESKEATVFKVSWLVGIIADLTREKRNLVVLDACYSGAAVGDFIHMSEHDAANLVHQQLYSTVPNPEEREADTLEEPGGAILFCAAGPKKWAKTPLEGTYTMFSGALKEVLDEGDAKGGPDLTVKRLGELVDAKIRRTFGTQAVKPQIHVPVQGGSDLLDSPFFPNPAFGTTEIQGRLRNVETAIGEIRQSVASLASAVNSLSTKKLMQPTFDPLEYGVRIKKPKKDGEIVYPPLTISGTVKKALPKGYELWMVGIGGPAGAPEYWPHKKVEILSDRKWEFDYDPKKFKEGELRRLQLYILGEEGQKLVFSTKYINEQHDKTSTTNPKPGHIPVLRLTSDFFEACPLLRIKLASPLKF